MVGFRLYAEQHRCHYLQLLIVDFEDVATLERVDNHLAVVPLLAKIDVEHLQAVGRCRIEQGLYGLAAHLRALCQGAEADNARLLGYGHNLLRERHIIPRHAQANLILRHALLVERYLHRTCGEIYLGQTIVQAYAV